jgi:asparagine synthase (glutamine-hydrolysing)
MCGILGIASNVAIEESEKFLQGIDLLNHRGPDDSGKWYSDDGCVAFAHKRLSIIDLSKNGHQPMVVNSGRFVIVFNGEIYNYLELFKILSDKGYRFSSKTDTEVILAAYREWGNKCVTFFNGMFAFAIYDSIKRTMFVSRDRAGEKPLFYSYKNGIFQFSSELKALLSTSTSPRKINTNSLDCYLSMGFVPGGRCILEGFNKLPAASSLLFDLNKKEIKVWQYWEVPDNNYISSDPLSELDLLDELEELLENSVRRQMVADVPVGILLSGGLDSSLITAMATRNTANVKTFTIRFPGSGKLDETEHARMISQCFETEHIELEAKPSSVDLLTKLAKQFDEPIIDSSMIPTFLVSQLVNQHCKVVLGGDGGDELFGGYKHYSRLLWMQKYFGLMPLSASKIVSYLSGKAIPVGMKGRNWLQSLNTDLNHGVPLIANYFDSSFRKKLMKEVHKDWPTVAESILQFRVSQNNDLLDRATHMDFTNFLPEDILVKVDRASMLNSLEVRSPFLDKHLIEFAFGEVPSHLKATSSDKKVLLKKLATRVLPPEFDQRRKQGFSIPINNWLKKGKFRDFFYDVLLDSKTTFDKDSVNALLKGQDKGRNNGERLFALLMFELWRREYRVSF